MTGDRAELAELVKRVRDALAETTDAVDAVYRYLTVPSPGATTPPANAQETALWEAHGHERPELLALAEDGAVTPVLAAALAARTERGDPLSIPAPDEEIEEALARFARHPAGIGQDLADAVRAVLDFSAHGVALGLIDVGASQGDPWLHEFTSADFPDYRQEVLATLNRLAAATEDERAKDAAVWLDQCLRRPVPVLRTDDGLRIVPPAVDSPWMRALRHSQEVVTRMGKHAAHPYEVGVPPLWTSMRTSLADHHVARGDSRVQVMPGRQGVLWRFHVWTGWHNPNGSFSPQDHARVVWAVNHGSTPVT